MKIKILWHSKQSISPELFKDIRISSSEFPELATVTCAVLSDTKNEETTVLNSFEFTRKLIKIESGQFLYFFDHGRLKDFFAQNIKHDLSAQLSPLNELRMKTEALEYLYPESETLFGLDLSQPRIMAVLNVTPDSFSDGGRYFENKDANQHAMKLISEGADILDIGGESSRPGAKPVAEEEELNRIIPVIGKIRNESDILISVDTTKSNIARQALEAGANWINDISGLTSDPEMVSVAGEFGCPVVVMHMQGRPGTMQMNPGYDNVITELLDYFEERINFLKESGVVKLILDPGIGFGKRLEDNIAILKHLRLFKQFGYPVLVGTSRKSFIGQITGREVGDRNAGTLASVVKSIENGAAIVRSHEVASVKDVINMVGVLREKNA